MIKNIAIPTGPDNPALLESFLRIPDPEDYYHGGVHGFHSLPDNILLFTRTRGLHLNSHRERHFHHRYILLLPLKGRGRVIVDEKACALSPGAALLIKPYQFHHYSGLPTGTIAWLFLSFDLVENGPQGPPVRKVDSAWFWADLGQLMNHYLLSDGLVGMRRVALRLALLLENLSPGSPTPAQSGMKPYVDEGLILKIHQLIRQTLSKPLSLHEMGVRLGLSESRLRTKFREATGHSLGDFQRTIRLQHAAQLLSRKKLSVGEVANACGWDSSFSFSRAFRSFWGIPPRDFRRGLRPRDSRT